MKVNRGNPEKGAVALLPQLHATPGLDWQKDPQLCKQVLASQMEILQQLRTHDAQHVIDESATSDEAGMLNDLHANLDLVSPSGQTMHEYATGVSALVHQMDKAAGVEDLMAKVPPDRLLQFMKLGAPKAHLMARKMADPAAPVRLHAAVPPHLESATNDLVAATDRNPALFQDQATRDFIFGAREQVVGFMAPRIIDKHPGKTVFLAYGADHDFKAAFAGQDAPALYRFSAPTATAFQAARAEPAGPAITPPPAGSN